MTISPSSGPPEGRERSLCDCWKREHQVCDVCQGVTGNEPDEDTEEPFGALIDWEAVARRIDEALAQSGQLVEIHRATLSLAALAVARFVNAPTSTGDEE